MTAHRAADRPITANNERAVSDGGTSELDQDVLQRPLSWPVRGWTVLPTVAVVIIAMMLRLLDLDAYVLGQDEAHWAYDAWSLSHGRPLPGTEQIPDTSPLFLLVEAFSFFLFGVTDAVARFGPALFGIGIVLLIVALHPFVTRYMLVSMALLAAMSPTLVFASRTVHSAIAIAFCSLLVVVALLRSGTASTGNSSRLWICLAGVGAAGMLGSGPEGVSALIAVTAGVVAGVVTDRGRRHQLGPGAVRHAVSTSIRSVAHLSAFVASFVIAILVFFTRMLTDVTAIEGFFTTFVDWGSMLASRASALPQSYFFYSILLYEILALVFAIVAVVNGPVSHKGHERSSLNPVVFAVWFVVSLILHSFASGRETEQAVLVTLPLVLLGGIGLGVVLGRFDWNTFRRTRASLIPVAMLGMIIGLIAILVTIARANDPAGGSSSGWPALLQILFVVVVVLLPLAYLIWSGTQGTEARAPIGSSALLVIALLLGLFTFRSTTALSFYRADDGSELLARNVPTEGVRALVDQVDRLSRDLSVDNMSNIDNTGSHGLSIGISPEVEWPFAWYFRDYQNLSVVSPAGWSDDTDVAIAPDSEGMDTAGLVVQQKALRNQTPNAYQTLDAETIFGDVFNTSAWYDMYWYLVFREMDSQLPPASLSVGYSFRVSNQINPNLGPFDLFTNNSPGPGPGLGQLSAPSGIAVSPDGEVIYVVNAGNQRIERYSRDGVFLGVWDSATDSNLMLSMSNGEGASGITIGDDGLIYVADTWNHIVIVLDQNGNIVRQLGQRAVLTDIGDGSDPATSPGLFFGPRGVAVTENEIYVTDTGNERVQVFSKDGTFLRAFGGFGTASGELQEPTGIAIGPDGNVYVADSGNGRISIFTPQGEIVQELAVASWQNQMGTDRKNDLAFGPDGVLYLTNPSQGIVEAWNGSGFIEIDIEDVVRPSGLAVTPDGTLLVTDSAESIVVQVQPDIPGGAGATSSPEASPMATPAE